MTTKQITQEEINRIHKETFPEQYKVSTTKDYLDEYAGAYRAVDMCDDDVCLVCQEDTERMQEIIKELETSIRKEVVSELYNYMETEGGRDLVKAYAEFNRIEIK